MPDCDRNFRSAAAKEAPTLMPLPSRSASRRQFGLLFLLFLGPVLVAMWMYSGSDTWKPAATTNNGRLLRPITNLEDSADPHSLSDLTVGQTDKRWVLIYVETAPCDESCLEALGRLHRSRLMLGKDIPRIKTVFLHGTVAPDTVFRGDQHRELISITDSGLANLLKTRRPKDLAAGGLYLIDPLGNLVMYFSVDLTPVDIVDDIKHLLNVSRIG